MGRRIVVAVLALTVVMLALLEIPLGISATERERDQLTVDLERDARTLGSLAEDTLEGIGDADLDAIAEEYSTDTGARVVVVDAEGMLAADSDPVPGAGQDYATRPEIATALEGKLATGTRRSDTLEEDLLFVAVPVASGGEVHGAVRLTYATTEVDERVRRVWLALGAVAVVSLVTAAALAVALTRWVTGPISELEDAAVAFGAGNLDIRAASTAGPPEVRSLAREFNGTAERLAELVNAQAAFVADASHQLRTPLTALRLRLENLDPVLGTDGQDDLEAALAEVSRLSRMVDGLLALSRADRTSTAGAGVAVDIATVLTDRWESWVPVAAERGVELTLEAPESMLAIATPDRLSQALDNLIDNAIEVSPRDGVISLRGARRAGQPVVEVTDEGPGMSGEQRERAFDRFWQGYLASGTSGLGLAIVRKLLRADGASIQLEDAPEGGLQAVITFAAPPSSAGGPP